MHACIQTHSQIIPAFVPHLQRTAICKSTPKLKSTVVVGDVTLKELNQSLGSQTKF
jgi:hypothetical protein